MSRTFGMPYMGSKSSIATWVVSKLPAAEVLVEPFAGGGAVTHVALLSNKYKRVIANDITDSALVFKKAVSGYFKNEKRWISREDFLKLKDSDPYVRYCFSFGNNQKHYCYNKDIEPYKRAFHYAVVFQDLDKFKELGICVPQATISSRKQIDRRLSVSSYLKWLLKRGTGVKVQLQSLESLERLERLERLENLERLQNLESYQGDYKSLQIPENSVIYCDPPYKGTAGYLNGFNHEEFYNWCLSQKQPIFISEYDMPQDLFMRVSAKSKRSLLNSSSKVYAIESLWVPRKKVKHYKYG